MIEWNAETEQWEVNGKKFDGEILWCNGWHTETHQCAFYSDVEHQSHWCICDDEEWEKHEDGELRI